MHGDQDTGASILVVEDDEQIAELMRDFLEAEGFQVRHAADGRETTTQLEHGHPDLVLLDVMLPDESGFEICRRLRHDSSVPVLFLSARDGDADKIRGLGLGGDDYIVKSATPAEVVARVKAVLRRTTPTGGRQRLRFGELDVDLAAHEVRCEGRLIKLTAREFELLRVLVEHPRQVFSRDQLFELVWGSFGDRSTEASLEAGGVEASSSRGGHRMKLHANHRTCPSNRLQATMGKPPQRFGPLRARASLNGCCVCRVAGPRCSAREGG
jgi:DNA-binding response OmpR family regulator